jgi:hypothetical protein
MGNKKHFSIAMVSKITKYQHIEQISAIVVFHQKVKQGSQHLWMKI